MSVSFCGHAALVSPPPQNQRQFSQAESGQLVEVPAAVKAAWRCAYCGAEVLPSW